MHSHPRVSDYWRRQGLPSFGAGNGHLIDSLKVTLAAAQALAHDGHTLRSVEIGGRNPVIWVHGGRACAELASAEYKITHSPTGSEHYRVALAYGVQVQWIEK